MAKVKKLNQLIATEPEWKGVADKIIQETIKVFRGEDLFSGLVKEYTPKVADGDPLPTERKEVVTTVQKRLDWTRKPVLNLLDYELMRDKTNQTASADLEVDGKVIASDVPVTTLLSLEKRLRQLRSIFDSIPTLDLSKKWEEVEDGIFKYGPIEQYRTAKKTVPVVLTEATKEHPAQVKDVVEDVMIGTYKSTYFSGAMHPRLKAKILERTDLLIEAVKTARVQGNDTEVKESRMGKAIFDYLFGESS